MINDLFDRSQDLAPPQNLEELQVQPLPADQLQRQRRQQIYDKHPGQVFIRDLLMARDQFVVLSVVPHEEAPSYLPCSEDIE